MHLMRYKKTKDLTGFSGTMQEYNPQFCWARLGPHPRDQRSNQATAALLCSGWLIGPMCLVKVLSVSATCLQHCRGCCCKEQSLGSHTSQGMLGVWWVPTWPSPCPMAITTWPLATFSYAQSSKMLSPAYPGLSQSMVPADS